jgi:hypothetical protein
MAVTSNTALRVTELDFNSIKNNLKNYLRSQSEFQDFDFEGSGMSVLLDILAYNTHYMGFYLNMTGNEMFLDTAQIRSSILSHAKAIGYIPHSKIGAQAVVNIQVTPSGTENDTATSLTMDKYNRFIAQDLNGVNYTFVNTEARTVDKSGGSFSFANVAIKQGEVVTNQFLMDASNTKRRFIIPSANVDTTSLSVTVQESVANTDTKTYLPYENMLDIDANSTVYFLEENEDYQYALYFGDDIIGKKPKVGNIITCTYLNIGTPANNISRFSAIDRIGNEYRNNVIVSTVSSSFGGSEKETIEQVRFRAPYAYQAQNRAVTATDYESIILRDFPIIDSAVVWGGEDNDPIVYGKVFMSLKTKQNFELSNIEKERITDTLIRNRNVVTVIPEIINPDYTYVIVAGRVTYNPSLTSKSANELLTLVKAAVDDYNSNELNKFSATFRKSKLQNYIESADPAITGSDIHIFVQKRVNLDINNVKNYNIPYNLELQKGSFRHRITTFPAINLADNNGVSRETYFEEILDAPTGINSITITNPGYSYTSAPTVTISGDGSGATAVARIVNGRIYSIDITNKGVNYTTASVTISGGDGADAAAVPNLENNYGTIRSYYITSAGEKIIVNENAGTVVYSTGTIVINSIGTTGSIENDLYDEDVLTITAPAENEIILPVRNRILLIDPNNTKSVQIEMIAEA